MMSIRATRPSSGCTCLLLAAILLLPACRPCGRVRVPPSARATAASPSPAPPAGHALKPIPRHGGAVLVAQSMPHNEKQAYRWARHIGTLVSYETFLRRYPGGPFSDEIRARIRERFVPADEGWQEAWSKHSFMDEITGAICDPDEGLILLGKPGDGCLPPFFYEDLIVAVRCRCRGGQVGVTMSRIFPARFDQPDDPRVPPYQAFETSVEFFSKHLWNTHLAFILFEGDRMLKSLSAGFDIFHGEPVRSSVPGFATQVEMAAQEPLPRAESELQEYGRVWIQLTSVKVNTTAKRNVAMFSNVKMEVRAESNHAAPVNFAQHIQDHYDEYAAEFVIFAEVERAARIVAIANWLVDNYPAVAQMIAVDSFEPVRVIVPQVIRARYDKTHDLAYGEAGLIGGVVFPSVNEYAVNPTALVADTPLADVKQKVLQCKPAPEAVAWSVTLGRKPDDVFVAWRITVPEPPRDELASADAEADTYPPPSIAPGI